MADSRANPGSDRLIVTIRSAYWVALTIVGAMALASYLLLQQMMAAHQRDAELLRLVEAQKTLSQRIVLLANAVETASPAEKRPLIAVLKRSTPDFRENHAMILERIGADGPAAGGRSGGFEDILFGPPYRLDHFSGRLAADDREAAGRWARLALDAALRAKKPKSGAARADIGPGPWDG